MAGKAKGKAEVTKDKIKWTKLERGKLDVWKPSGKGDSLQGKIISMSEGKFGPIIKVKVEDGKVRTLPNQVVLMGAIEENGFKPGDSIKIICTNMGSEKKGDYYDYDVFRAEGEGAF